MSLMSGQYFSPSSLEYEAYATTDKQAAVFRGKKTNSDLKFAHSNRVSCMEQVEEKMSKITGFFVIFACSFNCILSSEFLGKYFFVVVLYLRRYDERSRD